MSRVALAPIKDSQLNSSLPNTPRRGKPAPPSASSTPLAKRSASPRKSPLKLRTFARTGPRGEAAELAAAKLKVKLQLALYKIEQQRRRDFSHVELPSPSPTTMAPRDPKMSLSVCATRRLRFYKVRKSSSFYHHHSSQAMPLSKVSLPRISHHSQSFPTPFSAPQGPPAQSLPSINIILKTPIKNAARHQRALNTSHATTATDDTTIDEDHDATIAVDDGKKSTERRAKQVLTSSPLQNHLGTPNSFSVAKSLLQLAGNM
ncbi:hypothetical protein DICA3_F07184 [Diutina catenulata]